MGVLERPSSDSPGHGFFTGNIGENKPGLCAGVLPTVLAPELGCGVPLMSLQSGEERGIFCGGWELRVLSGCGEPGW